MIKKLGTRKQPEGVHKKKDGDPHLAKKLDKISKNLSSNKQEKNRKNHHDLIKFLLINLLDQNKAISNTKQSTNKQATEQKRITLNIITVGKYRHVCTV